MRGGPVRRVSERLRQPGVGIAARRDDLGLGEEQTLGQVGAAEVGIAEVGADEVGRPAVQSDRVLMQRCGSRKFARLQQERVDIRPLSGDVQFRQSRGSELREALGLYE